MIAFNATSSVFTDMSKPRGPGRPKKTGPYAAESRGGTIHPVVQQLCAWRVRHGLSQKQTVDLLRSYNFALTASALRNWEEGRRTPRDHTAEILGHLLKDLPSNVARREV